MILPGCCREFLIRFCHGCGIRSVSPYSFYRVVAVAFLFVLLWTGCCYFADAIRGASATLTAFFKPSSDPSYGIMAVLVGALLAVPSYFYAARKFKIDNAFELQKEINDTENYRRRHEAWGFMEAKCYLPNKHLDYYRGSSENWSGGQPHISTVYFLLSFFERLWLVIQHQRVKRRFVRTVFGRVFFWWYIMYFEDYVLASPESREHGYFRYLNDLKKWFEFHTPRMRIDQWVAAAREHKSAPRRVTRFCACPSVGCGCSPVQ